MIPKLAHLYASCVVLVPATFDLQQNLNIDTAYCNISQITAGLLCMHVFPENIKISMLRHFCMVNLNLIMMAGCCSRICTIAFYGWYLNDNTIKYCFKIPCFENRARTAVKANYHSLILMRIIVHLRYI